MPPLGPLLEPSGKLGDALADGAGVRSVVVGNGAACGGGAVVGAGRAHVVSPRQTDDDHAAGEHPVDERQEGELNAGVTPVTGGEGGADLAVERAFFPKVALVVQPGFEAARDAAPVGRAENQRVGVQEVLALYLGDVAKDGFCAGRLGYPLGDGLGKLNDLRAGGVVEDEDSDGLPPYLSLLPRGRFSLSWLTVGPPPIGVETFTAA